MPPPCDFACPLSPPGFSVGRRCCKTPSRGRSKQAGRIAIHTLDAKHSQYYFKQEIR